MEISIFLRKKMFLKIFFFFYVIICFTYMKSLKKKEGKKTKEKDVS